MFEFLSRREPEMPAPADAQAATGRRPNVGANGYSLDGPVPPGAGRCFQERLGRFASPRRAPARNNISTSRMRFRGEFIK